MNREGEGCPIAEIVEIAVTGKTKKSNRKGNGSEIAED
jgi:hypothetical protein